MKILLYCYADIPFFYVELVRYARSHEAYRDIQWNAVLPYHVYKQELQALLGSDAVFSLQPALNILMKEPRVDLSELSQYPGSLSEDIAVDKGEGKLKHSSKEYQMKHAYNVYRAYKQILLQSKPDAVFFPIIETHDAKILYNLCKELAIEPVLYSNARNLSVSYFSNSHVEKLPQYVLEGEPSAVSRQNARAFIEDFRRSPKSAFSPPYIPQPEEVLSFQRTPRWKKLGRYLYQQATNQWPHLVSDKPFKGRVETNIAGLLNRFRTLRGEFEQRYYDIHSPEDLPARFVYFPLQVTPESSINVLAPYYADQLRALDLLLFNLPSDVSLVVKEHPSMQGKRPRDFLPALKKRAGLILANPRMDSLTLCRRTLLTVSITGTACLETFLLGKPSLQMGENLVSDWLFKFESMSSFREQLVKAMATTEIPMEHIVDFVARVFEAGHDFVLFNPTDHYISGSLMMNTRNIENFLSALKIYLTRMGRYAHTPAALPSIH